MTDPAANTRQSTVDPAILEVIAIVRDSWDLLLERAVAEIWDQVPGYARSSDYRLRPALVEHVDSIFEVVLNTLASGRPAHRSAFSRSMTQARLRARQGINFPDFLHAFRVGQRVLWESFVEAAQRDEATRSVALSMATEMLRAIETGTSAAATSYLEVQQHQLAEAERIRRDLLEDILARRDLSEGPTQALLRSYGLDTTVELIVVSMVPQEPLPAELTLRDVVAVLRDALAAGAQSLAVIRREEVVCVSPVKAARLPSIVEKIEKAARHLKASGVKPAVGISTVHTGIVGIPEAYTEACVARDGLGTRPGVLALPMLSTLDYLLLRHDHTARRLIPARLAQFVQEDSTDGGDLISTFLEYVAADLNAKAAAERLYLHVNTAYYRLARIAERTGCDLRHIADIQELVVAIRLLTPLIHGPV